MTEEQKVDSGIMALTVAHGDAENIITFLYVKGGPAILEEQWVAANSMNQPFKVVRMYKFNPSQQESLRGVVEMTSTPFKGQENIRLVSNLPTLLWELDSIFEIQK